LFCHGAQWLGALLLETKSSRATRSIGRLLLLETKSSKAKRSIGHHLLLLETKSSMLQGA
jgi:hypothetical protein